MSTKVIYKSELTAFVREYIELCRKHGVILDSCGCCDSPWPVKAGENGTTTLEDHIKHVEEQLNNRS